MSRQISPWDDARKWEAMLTLICGAEAFFLAHDGAKEWDALMDEVNRVLDLDDATMAFNHSERPIAQAEGEK